MKRRLAIPVLDDQLSPYFGACNHYMIYEADKGGISRLEIRHPEELSIAELPAWVASYEITDLIANHVDAEIIERFALFKINLFVGIPVDSPVKILDDWLKGRLESDQQIIKQIALSITK